MGEYPSEQTESLASMAAKLPASLGKKLSTTSLSVVLAPATRNIVSHDRTMTGAAIPLSLVSAIYQKITHLQVGSAGTCYYGDSAVVSGHGVPLSTTIPRDIEGPIDAANVYVIGTASDVCCWTGLYEV
jgi:hypothetical protein